MSNKSRRETLTGVSGGGEGMRGRNAAVCMASHLPRTRSDSSVTNKSRLCPTLDNLVRPQAPTLGYLDWFDGLRVTP